MSDTLIDATLKLELARRTARYCAEQAALVSDDTEKDARNVRAIQGVAVVIEEVADTLRFMQGACVECNYEAEDDEDRRTRERRIGEKIGGAIDKLRAIQGAMKCETDEEEICLTERNGIIHIIHDVCFELSVIEYQIEEKLKTKIMSATT